MFLRLRGCCYYHFFSNWKGKDLLDEIDKFHNNAKSPASGGFHPHFKVFTRLSKHYLFTFSYQTYPWVMYDERCFHCKPNWNLGNCLPKLQSHLPNRERHVTDSLNYVTFTFSFSMIVFSIEILLLIYK